MAKHSIIASELAPSDSRSQKGNWSWAHYDPHGVGDLRDPWARGDKIHGFEWGHASRCWCVCWARVSCVSALDSLRSWTSIQSKICPLWEGSWLCNPSPEWLLWPQGTQHWSSAKTRKTRCPLNLFNCLPIPSSPSYFSFSENSGLLPAGQCQWLFRFRWSVFQNRIILLHQWTLRIGRVGHPFPILCRS